MYNLYPHNQFAYDKLKSSLEVNQRACIVQPTGTGKSYITAEFLKENPTKKFLLLTSNNYIIDQFNKSFRSSYDNYKYISYPSLLSGHFKELLNSFYDYIILDEFHRVGAENWGLKVNELLDNNSNTKVIGLTATHIRYMEEERDIVEELFNGNLVHNLTLMECFDTGILPRPKYISTIYNIDDEYNSLIAKIDKSKSSNKTQLKERIIEYKANWEYSYGVDTVLKKHIKKEKNFIVFCKDINHLKEMIPVVRNWFKIFKRKINIYKVYSLNVDSKNQLDKFEEKSIKNEIEFNLLFSIQQLNEGLHAPNIDGVIFLRPTNSHIIYYQQLGRSLETKGKQPIVFDMVNNFKKSQVHNDFNSKNYIPIFRNNYLKTEYQNYKFSFQITDEIEDIRKLFLSININSICWNEKFQLLEDEIKEKGDYSLVSKYLKGWVRNQKKEFKRSNNKFIWKERIEKFKKIGIVLVKEYNVNPTSKYNINIGLKRYLSKIKNKEEFDRIDYNWIYRVRNLYKNDKLLTSEIELLNVLNEHFSNHWSKTNVSNTIFFKNYFKLKDYLSSHNHNNKLPKKFKTWVRDQRYYCKNSKNKKNIKERISFLEALKIEFSYDWKYINNKAK